MSYKTYRILVVDDNTASLTVINGILSVYYKVYAVSSGALALRFLKKRRPDLILLDIEMPELSGIEVFEIIRANPKLANIPVIFLTGNTDIACEVEAFRLGASDYIHKPVNDVIMLSRIKMHLELDEYRRTYGSF